MLADHVRSGDIENSMTTHSVEPYLFKFHCISMQLDSHLKLLQHSPHRDSSMMPASWFERLISAAGLHSIWRDIAPPGSNDAHIPTSRALLHTTLHGLLLLVALRLLKWMWTKARPKPTNTTLLKPNATKGGASENKYRQHGGQSGYLSLALSTHQMLQFQNGLRSVLTIQRLPLVQQRSRI